MNDHIECGSHVLLHKLGSALQSLTVLNASRIGEISKYRNISYWGCCFSLAAVHFADFSPLQPSLSIAWGIQSSKNPAAAFISDFPSISTPCLAGWKACENHDLTEARNICSVSFHLEEEKTKEHLELMIWAGEVAIQLFHQTKENDTYM